MELGDLLTSPWVVGLATSVATTGVLATGRFALAKVRSRRGAFSGQYLALTGDPAGGRILVEDVKCHQIGNRLSGRIRGVATLLLDPESGKTSEKLDNRGRYRFDGFADGRVFVISYRTILPGVQSAGSIALKGEESGKVFSGTWAGLSRDDVMSAPCTWIRIVPPVSSDSQREAFLMQAEQYLLPFRSARYSRAAYASYASSKSVGKSAALDRLPGILLLDPLSKSDSSVGESEGPDDHGKTASRPQI